MNYKSVNFQVFHKKTLPKLRMFVKNALKNLMTIKENCLYIN